MEAKRQKFAILRASRRVWAIGSIHGDSRRIEALHHALGARLQFGDRLVYLGNIIGWGDDVRGTLDELLLFRREFLAQPFSIVEDIAYLRGSQEEMWQKLLQLQFAADPRAVMEWMLGQGVGATLAAYGVPPEEGLRKARSGPMHITRWTGELRQAMRAVPGHAELLGAVRRAAYTDDGALLFVNAGIDPSRPLEAQKDSFWWGYGRFSAMTETFGGFRCVVRGFAPEHPGLEVGDFTATLDGGCGFGGPLIAACFLPSGEMVDHISV